MGLNSGTIRPLVEQYGDIKFTNTLQDCVSDQQGNLYLTDTVGNFYNYSLSTLTAQKSTLSAYGSGASNLALISSLSAVLANQSNTGVVLVELATNFKQSYTTSADLVSGNGAGKGQMIDADPVNKIAFYPVTTSGKVNMFSGVTYTTTQYTPTVMSGTTGNCVLFKADTSTFLIGTNNGIVFEINSSGTVLNSITLPTTPNAGTPPVHKIVGMSYYNGYLLVVSTLGVMYHYSYASNTLLSKKMYVGDGNGQYNAICSNMSGIAFLTCGSNGQSYAMMVLDINASALMSYDTINFGSTNARVGFIGYDNSLNRGFLMQQATNGQKIRVFNFLPVCQYTTDDTRSQDPIGIDEATTILRILTRRPGTSRIDFNAPVASGDQNITGVRKYTEYIELSIESGGNIDFRITST